MTLDNHPNVFRYEGKLWVSELPREVMRAQFIEQRAWDATHLKSERWTLSLVLGALAGVAGTLVGGTSIGLAPAIYLVLLPVGFGAGVVLGALVNRWLLRQSEQTASHSPTVRPELGDVVRVPSGVARKADEFTPTHELIEWSRRGFAPQ